MVLEEKPTQKELMCVALFKASVFVCLVMCMCWWGETTPFFRGSLGVGDRGGLTMGWRVGCINKLPHSKLSAVTEPRGWSFRCFH